jgi:hypothetical protein
MKQPEIWWNTPDDGKAVPPELVAEEPETLGNIAAQAPVPDEVA